MSRYLLYLLLVLVSPGLAHAHELPDGEIERRVQVSVKPDCILVEYSLVMNETTLEDELKKHKLKPAEKFDAKWKQYEKEILPTLAKHMRLTANGKASHFKPIQSGFTGFSHRKLTCLLKAEVLLTQNTTTIEVTDGNFLEVPGNYRIAMKSRSGVEMENANVPPLVTRAKSVDLTTLTKNQKQAAVRAQGEFALVVKTPVEHAKPVSLFNGKNLEGWYADVPDADNNPDIKPSFLVRDGKLVSMGVPRGHLITKKSFKDYRLEVQYRFAGKPGNCGVLVHTDGKRPRVLYKMFPASLEVQMQHKAAGDFWCIHEDIKVPNMADRRKGPKENWGGKQGQSRHIRNLTDDSEKPLGEWNTMIIECLGDKIRAWVNGDLVNDGYECTAKEGQISLQAEGAEVEFRKLELTPITKLTSK